MKIEIKEEFSNEVNLNDIKEIVVRNKKHKIRGIDEEIHQTEVEIHFNDGENGEQGVVLFYTLNEHQTLKLTVYSESDIEANNNSYEEELKCALNSFKSKGNASNHIDSEKLYNCIPKEVKDDLADRIVDKINSDILGKRSDQ